MSQSTITAAKGLYTYPSDIAGVPLGSAALALNVNINREGVIESRRGYGNLTYALPSGTDRLKKLFFWNSEIFGLYNTSNFAYYNPASGWSSRGTLIAPTNATSSRAVSSLNKNLYLTSSTGLQKTDAVANSIYAAGMPKALTIDLSIAGAGSAVVNNNYASYQYLIGRKDANGNIQYGSPSGTFTIQNTAGSTQNITAKCYLPSGLNTSHFVQLYRTYDATTTPSSSDPQLTYELSVGNTDISNGYVTITDITPTAQLGASIYTGVSQEGISAANDQPPLASDIAEFKGCMFYADIAYRQLFTASLLGVGGTGLVNTDTFVITDGTTTETYTGAAAEDVPNSKFLVYTGGSVSQNIDATMKSLVKVINNKSALLYGFIVPYSTVNPFPGKAIFEGRSLATTQITFSTSRTVAFSPTLDGTSTASKSAADTFRNGLAISKANQPEACPRAYILKVGAADDPILRILPLRDGLMIYKQRGGVYVCRGSGITDFAVTLVDSTAKLLAPDSLAVVNNAAFGLFESGICRVDDQNVRILSDRIKDQILPLVGSSLAQLKALSFGYGSDTDGKYTLAIPQASTDTYAKRQIVYDVFGDTFVNWDMQLACGGVNPVDAKSYLGYGDTSYIGQEKRVFDYTDFADTNPTLMTVSAFVGTTVTINNTAQMAVGDILAQGTTAFGYITAVSLSTGSVTIDVAQTWTLNTADVIHYKGIGCKWQWNPDTGGAPAGLKQYYEAALINKQAFQGAYSVIYSSDLNPAEVTVSLTSSSGNGVFGQFEFGQEVFGGDQARAPKRLGIPRGLARCNQLNVRFETRVALSDFQVEGLSLSFVPTSSRTTR